MKVTGIKHKDLINFQFEELNVKSNAAFYQRQCGVTKSLLEAYSYEDLLLVLKMYKEIGLPKGYKSIYYLKNDTQKQIESAKNYFANKLIQEEVIKIQNVKKRYKEKIECIF